MKKENRGLYYLVFRAMAVVTSVIIISFNLYMYYNNIHKFRSEIEEKIAHNMESVDEDISDFHESNNNIVEVFSNNPIAKKLHTSHFSEDDLLGLQNAYNQTYDFVSSIYLGTASGHMYTAKGDNLPEDYDPRERPWYKESSVSAVQPRVTALYRDAGGEHEYAITYVKNMYQGMEKIAVVGVDIDLHFFQKMLANFAKKNDASMLVLGGSNEVLVASSSDTELDEVFSTILYKEFEFGEGDKSSLVLNNVEYHMYMKRNRALNWTIIEIVPKSLMVNNIYRTLQITILTTLLAIVLVVLFTINTRKLLIKPIDIIVENINSIKDGEYSNFQELNKDEYREFVVIQNEIRLMSHQINETTGELIKKEQEISTQYDEINGLYEETVAMNENQEELFKELHESYGQTIASLSKAMEANDLYTKGHCNRVSELSLIIGEKIELSNSEMRILEYAAQLHDIGKVGVPTHIINKEGPLDEDEYDWIKKHPLVGYMILKDIQFLSKEAEVVLKHHERYDGKGYPEGTIGEDIPLLSRVISIADAYDAMTSSRSYRKRPLSIQEANMELIRGKGTQFDPMLVEAFLSAEGIVTQEIVDQNTKIV